MKTAALLFATALLASGCGGAVAPGATTGHGASPSSAATLSPPPSAVGSVSPAASPQAGCPSVLTGEGGPPEPVAPPDDLRTLKVDGRVDLPEESLFVASSGGALWATSPAGKLWRINARTAKVTATVDLPDLGFARPLATADAVWVAEMVSGRLLRLDPNDGSTVSNVDLEPADRPMALAATETGLLVANQTTNTMSFVDAESMTVTQAIDLSEGAPGGPDRAPASIAVDGGIAWLVEHRAHALARVALADTSVTRTCLGDLAAGQLVAVGGKLWVAGAGGVVSVVDADSGAVTSRLFLPAVTAGDLAVDGDRVWVGAGSHVVGIDTAAGEVDTAAPTGDLSDERQFAGGVAIAVTSDSVWTTDPAGYGLLRFTKAAR